MEAFDLERVDTAVRALCAQHDLAWMLTVVDAAINDGHADSVTPGSSAYRERGIGWLQGFSYDPDAAKRPQPEIRQRPLTMTERVVLLLDAMLSVYRDLPEIELATIGTLRQGWSGRVTPPDTITFVHNGHRGAEDVGLETESPENTERRQRVVEALTRLRHEVLR